MLEICLGVLYYLKICMLEVLRLGPSAFDEPTGIRMTVRRGT
jgi:hypothetical protein